MNKFYVTTSIAYVNASPHIGFALESIQADVIARYSRLLGKEVFFLTGTDEHGAKICRAAEKEGKSPEDFTNEISAKFKGLKDILNLSNDDFIRTTDQKRHWPSAQKVWLQLKENGDIYKKEYNGLYCVGCEAFITKKDLIDGKCIYHQKEPEVIKEENYFFRLSKYQEKIKEAIEKDEIKIIPEGKKNEMLSFIEQGLEDISFSRPRKDLKWGIPVPDDDSQAIYVWADALVNYISALDYADNGDKFKKFWPADVHCIGKDIQKFHCLIWPGMLISLGLEFPKKIFVHGYLTSNGQKMSKSLGNVIDPFELVKKYSTDAVRYFLLREISPTEDGDFSYEKFEQRYNADLAGGLGNLVSRVSTMVEKYCDGKVPNIDKNPEDHPLRVDKNIHNWKNVWVDLDKYLSNYQFNEVLFSIWKFITEADKYIENAEPWKLAKEGRNEELNWVLYGLLDAIHQISWQIYIFMPEASLQIAEAFGVKNLLAKKPNYKDSWINIESGIKIKKGESLFPRIK